MYAQYYMLGSSAANCCAHACTNASNMASGTTTTVTHPDGTSIVCVTAAVASPPKDLKLMYFDGRGLMELPRTLLAIAGRFPGEDYEDLCAALAFPVDSFWGCQGSAV